MDNKSSPHAHDGTEASRSPSPVRDAEESLAEMLTEVQAMSSIHPESNILGQVQSGTSNILPGSNTYAESNTHSGSGPQLESEDTHPESSTHPKPSLQLESSILPTSNTSSPQHISSSPGQTPAPATCGGQIIQYRAGIPFFTSQTAPESPSSTSWNDLPQELKLKILEPLLDVKYEVRDLGDNTVSSVGFETWYGSWGFHGRGNQRKTLLPLLLTSKDMNRMSQGVYYDGRTISTYLEPTGDFLPPVLPHPAIAPWIQHLNLNLYVARPYDPEVTKHYQFLKHMHQLRTLNIVLKYTRPASPEDHDPFRRARTRSDTSHWSSHEIWRDVHIVDFLCTTMRDFAHMIGGAEKITFLVARHHSWSDGGTKRLEPFLEDTDMGIIERTVQEIKEEACSHPPEPIETIDTCRPRCGFDVADMSDSNEGEDDPEQASKARRLARIERYRKRDELSQRIRQSAFDARVSLVPLHGLASWCSIA